MEIRLLTQLGIRNDAEGKGHYGAPRGGRTHNGIDFAAAPGSVLLSPVAGTVSRHGYPYSNDFHFQYIQITDRLCPPMEFGPRELYRPGLLKCKKCGIDHLNHRFFYVIPLLEEGKNVEVGDPIGIVQDIRTKYNSTIMIPHVHYEVKQLTFFLDPEKVAKLM